MYVGETPSELLLDDNEFAHSKSRPSAVQLLLVSSVEVLLLLLGLPFDFCFFAEDDDDDDDFSEKDLNNAGIRLGNSSWLFDLSKFPKDIDGFAVVPADAIGGGRLLGRLSAFWTSSSVLFVTSIPPEQDG